MLSIHPIKTEAMILTKQDFIGPAPPPPPQYCSETSMSTLWIILLV